MKTLLTLLFILFPMAKMFSQKDSGLYPDSINQSQQNEFKIDSVFGGCFIIDKANWIITCDTNVVLKIYTSNANLIFDEKGREFDITSIDTIRELDKNMETHYFLFINHPSDSCNVVNYEFTMKNSPSNSMRPFLFYYDPVTDNEFFFSQKGFFEVFIKIVPENSTDNGFWKKIHMGFGNKFFPSEIKVSSEDYRLTGPSYLIKFNNENGYFEAIIPYPM